MNAGMKTYSLMGAAVLALLLVSCKKLYTCNCSTVSNTPSSSGSLITNTKSVQYNEKMTRSQAKAACEHEQASIKSTEESFFLNSGYTVTANTSCVIQ